MQAFKLELFEHALGYLEGIPEKQLDLSKWTTRGGDRTDCDTIACGAGWLIRHRDFQVDGWCLDKEGEILSSRDGAPSGFGFAYIMALFNMTAGEAATVFGISNPADPRSDKEILLARMKKLILKKRNKASQST